jgi:hypothetical protein
VGTGVAEEAVEKRRFLAPVENSTPVAQLVARHDTGLSRLVFLKYILHMVC